MDIDKRDASIFSLFSGFTVLFDAKLKLTRKSKLPSHYLQVCD